MATPEDREAVLEEAIRDLKQDREILSDRVDALNHVVVSMQRRLARMFEEYRALQARVNVLQRGATLKTLIK
jgi:uncharacterized protein (DUF3084 family)